MFLNLSGSAWSPRSRLCSTIVLGGILGCVLPAHSASKEEARSIALDDRTLTLRSYHPSLSGNFFFNLTDLSERDSLPRRSQLLAINSAGDILFHRTFTHAFKQLALAMDFKPIEPGLYMYGYGSMKSGVWPLGFGAFHFLDKSFHDIFPFPVPEETPDSRLEIHDAVRAPNGNYFYIFYRKSGEPSKLNVEIQEWNKNGEVVFTWDYLEHFKGVQDASPSPEVDAMDIDAKGNIFISLIHDDEIIKIDYPTGKVAWRLSSRNWRFVNDPWKGFRYQHTIKALPNGNILLFDIGVDHPSRAVEYELDAIGRVAKLVWEYRATELGGQRYSGSVQRLSNGNTLIGWGAIFGADAMKETKRVLFTEVARSGEIVRELVSSPPAGTYRVNFEAKPD